MASIIAVIKAIPKLVDLVQMFVEAWLSYQVAEINDDHKKKAAARSALIRKIDEARKAKNREDLIALNHALVILERGKL
jgi:hypothetical protein